MAFALGGNVIQKMKQRLELREELKDLLQRKHVIEGQIKSVKRRLAGLPEKQETVGGLRIYLE